MLQDVLKVDLKALIAAEFPGMPVAVCANLPYYITSQMCIRDRSGGVEGRQQGQRRQPPRLHPVPAQLIHREGVWFL